MTIKTDILTDKDLDIAATYKSHNNIDKEELEKIINKLDIKMACKKDKITNKIITLTYNDTKSFPSKTLL